MRGALVPDPIGLEVFRDVVAAAPNAVVVIGPDSTIRLWNAAAESILGWPAEDVIGRRDPSIAELDQASVDARFHELLEDPTRHTRSVLRRVRPDGSLVHVLVDSISTIELHDGRGLVVWSSPAGGVNALLSARNQLSRRLVTAQRTDEITPVVVAALQAMVGAPGAIVLRRCPAGEHLHGLWAMGVDQADAEQLELPLPGPNAEGDDVWVGAVGGQAGEGAIELGGAAREALFVPMGPAGDGWVLAVLDAERIGDATVRVDLASAVADETYIALQRAELVSELDGKIEILEATAALAGSVGLAMDDALVSIATQAAAALSCERSAIYLMDEDDEVVLAHVRDANAVPAVLRSASDGLDLAREVIESGTRLLHQDVSACEMASGPWHEDAGTVAVLGLPLIVAGRTIGALVVAHTIAHPRGFTSLCTQVGAAVAQQAAIALEQARLYEVERGTVTRLRELDRMKADWMAGITHDLKAPLTGLLGFVETLRRLTGQVSAEQQAEFLEVMARQAGQLVALVEDLLLSARIDADAVARRRELIPVSELIAGAAESLGHDEQVALVIDDQAPGASVVGDRLHVQRILQNLLSNAWRYGASGVTVAAHSQGGDVVITVDDDGPGVPVEDRELVFERFQHGDTAGSTGLGLYVARGIAEAHGGTLRVTETPSGQGARFELRLPHSRRQRQADLVDKASVDPENDRRQADIELPA